MADCAELMKRMPEECVDYIFTDPPYDASVQYGELSYLWNAWLKEDYHYAEKIVTHEIVRNEQDLDCCGCRGRPINEVIPRSAF